MAFDIDFVASERLRFMAGVGIIGSFITVVNILTFAKVWEDTFEYFGIPAIAVYTLLPIGYVGGCWLVGYAYDTFGLWKAETKFSNKRQNNEFLEMYNNVSEMKSDMERIMKKLEIEKSELKR